MRKYPQMGYEVYNDLKVLFLLHALMCEPIPGIDGDFAGNLLVIKPFCAFVLVFPRVFVRLQAGEKEVLAPDRRLMGD